MITFIGLGNPGLIYSETKHNAGYWVVDELAKRWKIKFHPGKGNYVYSNKNNGKALLIKPTTGMNLSGTIIKSILENKNISADQLCVIVDDVDLPLGKIRIRPKGGDGCHRGMESIIYHLGTNCFNRLRIGVSGGDYKRPSEKYVMKTFRKSDMPLVKEIIQTSADAAESILYAGLDNTMNKFNS